MNILFLCVANSARSQMAEGLAKEILGESHNIQSAGSNPSGKVHPNAIKVMQQIDIDISFNYSKSILDLDKDFLDNLDYAITMCEEEVCPVLPTKAKKINLANLDPDDPMLNEEKLDNAFLKARKNISKQINDFINLEKISNL